ncbi:MAG: hypothetical protein PVF58_10105 [Candidatus Methanofastidiosia archaeon]|jgi:hypothetical protein
MNIALFYNRLRAKWEGKFILISLAVPALIALTTRMAFENIEMYDSVESIYALSIQISFMLIVPLGVFIAHWDQKNLIHQAQLVLTKPVSRLKFFAVEYLSGVIVIGFIAAVTGGLTMVISAIYNHFSWRLAIVFSCSLFTILLLEAVMLLISQVISQIKALIVGMGICTGGLARLQTGYLIEKFFGIKNTHYILPNLQFGMLTSTHMAYNGSFPLDFLIKSFAVWVTNLVIIIVVAYFIFSRRNL